MSITRIGFLDELRNPELPITLFDKARQEFLEQFSEMLDRACQQEALDEYQSTIGALLGLVQLRFNN